VVRLPLDVIPSGEAAALHPQVHVTCELVLVLVDDVLERLVRDLRDVGR